MTPPYPRSWLPSLSASLALHHMAFSCRLQIQFGLPFQVTFTPIASIDFRELAMSSTYTGA